MASMPPKAPLVVVVGATGTGKSKLAVELATKFNGEIINADAIQMYRGLPIVTNKIPQDERNGIPHHLLDQIDLQEKPWTVHDFVEESSKIIDQIRGRGRLPIVVGGTNYYVYSLLFEHTTIPSGQSDGVLNADIEAEESRDGSHADLTILDAPTEDMYAKLQAVDPDIARTWHPKDRRRIQRSLEIWLKTGKKASEIYAEQKGSSAGVTETLRFDPIIFWLDADDAVLKQRLNTRVDAMVKQGLLEEGKTMRQFELQAQLQGVELDKTKGIWVAIGYKELEPWLDTQNESTYGKPPASERDAPELQLAGIEAIKSGTRQYAKRQNRWVRIKLAEKLQALNSLGKLFLLDCTNLKAWDEMVAGPSDRVLQQFLAGKDLPKSSSMSELALRTFTSIAEKGDKPSRQTRYCEPCKKTLMSEQHYAKHLKSQSHKKVLDGIRKRTQRDLYLNKMDDNG
ncbi:tRNA dimethylallyltransferase, mitochondrial [Knufia obscura]|uniref:tRNA dimethylallyltransferase n=1 Tax=Knufia obscura TaxID=1635080 RepID=A0ABR0RNV4_9EURO|nr:tRNA dimethylallyltransferase, mitochondrial [Knufia obscura]